MSKFWGGGGCQKPTNQSQHMGSQCSGRTKLQPPLSTAMFYCYNLNYNILTVFQRFLGGDPGCWKRWLLSFESCVFISSKAPYIGQPVAGLKRGLWEAKTSIFVPFGAVHGFSRLVPDWFRICRKRCWNLPKAVSDFGPKFAELDDFLGFGKCFGGFGAGGG